MPELIRRGYVWIAQPPLYKLKSGKKSRFLEDQNALDLEIAGIGSEHLVAPTGATGEPLAASILELRGAYRAIEEIGLKLKSDELADALVTSGVVAAIATAKGFERKIGQTEKLLNAGRDSKKDGKWSLHVNGTDIVAAFEIEGVIETTRMKTTDFVNGDGRMVAKLQDKIDALFGAGDFEISGKRERVLGPLALWRLVEARGRKGTEIQRFKGLGEMNADELWDTTLDPNARRLLQVDIVDTERADELFSILMGEAVEQRRAFIEEHGLEADLDI
jgi:DNA gyrase subunit B